MAVAYGLNCVHGFVGYLKYDCHGSFQLVSDLFQIHCSLNYFGYHWMKDYFYKAMKCDFFDRMDYHYGCCMSVRYFDNLHC